MKQMLFRFFQILHNTFLTIFWLYFAITIFAYGYFSIPMQISTKGGLLQTAYIDFRPNSTFTIAIDKRLNSCLQTGYIEPKCAIISPIFNKILDVYNKNLSQIKAKKLKTEPNKYSEIIDEWFGESCEFVRLGESETKIIQCGNQPMDNFDIGFEVEIDAYELITSIQHKGSFKSLKAEIENSTNTFWMFYGFGFLILLHILEYVLFGVLKIGFLRKKDYRIFDYL